MFERFTDRARKIMALANQEAQHRNHDHIAPEHILLGLVKEGSGIGANVLKNMDVKLDDVRREIDARLPSVSELAFMGKLPMTPQAKATIDHAVEEVRRLNHNYVGSEHLLLGLLHDAETMPAQVLAILGVKLDQARAEVLLLLGIDIDESNPIPAPVLIPRLEYLGRQLKRQVFSDAAGDGFGSFGVSPTASGGKITFASHVQSELTRESLELPHHELAAHCMRTVAQRLESIAASLRASADKLHKPS